MLRHNIALICFFLSGVAGLIYEICWIRKAALVFGSTTFALSTVLAVFFAGLAIGSLLFGRLALRRERPLRLYAGLEIGVGAAAILSLPAFALVNNLYGEIFPSFAGNLIGLSLVRIGLVSLVLLPPTIMMGGTLPLFCRQFVLRRGNIAGSVGFLYGINTLGATIGCAVAGFWLIPLLGVVGSVVVAAVLNVIAGIVILLLPLAPPQHEQVTAKTQATVEQSRKRLIVATLFFLTGLIALGSEILWSRFLALLVQNSVYTYTITLTVVLAGIVLGSLLASRVFDRRLPRALSFGALQVLSALSILTLMLLPVAVWRDVGAGIATYCLLMLIPAVLSGASFPLANRMVFDDPALSAASVGRMTALNTFGGIVGSLLVGFVLLPLLGLSTCLRILTLLGLLSGCAAWLFLANRQSRLPRFVATAVAIVFWLGIPSALDTRLPADFLAPRDQLIDFHEGLTSSLSVVRDKGSLQLHINRLWQGRDRKSHQIMAAHVPMLIHPDPQSVLVIGVGTGQTPSRFLLYDIDRLDCVDIEPAIFPFIAKHFDAPWLHDQRTNLITDDGRSFLAHGKTMYDLISVEVGQVFRPGIEAFYTTEFYAEAFERLNPGGLMAQFVPLALCSQAQFRSIIATFLANFPEAVLWYNTTELLLIGTKSEHLRIDPRRLMVLGNNLQVQQDLSYSQWGGQQHWLNNPMNFLGGFLCGPGELAELVAEAPLYKDNKPTLAYAASAVRMDDANEIPMAQLIREHLTSITSLFAGQLPPADVEKITNMQTRNLRDIIAGSILRRIEWQLAQIGPQGAIDQLEQALRWNPDNALTNRMMADALVLNGQDAPAEPYYQKALSLTTEDPLTHRGYGLILLRANRVPEALDRLEKAIEMIPDDPASHNYLGAALAAQGQLQQAIYHFQQALQLRPDDQDAARNLERAQAQLGQL